MNSTNLLRFGAALVAFGVGLYLYWLLAPRGQSFGMFEGAESAGTLRFALTFLATVAGVVFGSAYRQLRALQTGGATTIEHPGVFLSNLARSIDMWLGLVGSPVVYALLLKTSDGMSLPGLLTVAFENGFCCFLVINGLLNKAEQQQKPAGAGG